MLPELVVDIRGGNVQIDIKDDGKVLWVNVDGVCRLRVATPESIEISDWRKEQCCLPRK